MIVRQGLNFAVHAAGGVAMGVALVLAGTMLARLAARSDLMGRAREMSERFGTMARGAASEPDSAPPPEH